MGIGPSSIIIKLSEDFNYLELCVGTLLIERIGLDTIDDIRMGMGCMSNIVESGVDPLKSFHIRGEFSLTLTPHSSSSVLTIFYSYSERRPLLPTD